MPQLQNWTVCGTRQNKVKKRIKERKNEALTTTTSVVHIYCLQHVDNPVNKPHDLRSLKGTYKLPIF